MESEWQKPGTVFSFSMAVILLFADVSPRILAPRNQLIKVIQNNRTRLDCPFFGSPIPTLRW